MRQGTPSYSDFVEEQLRGAVHGVFIDDTGSPGLRDTPLGLHPDRKSWVAVIIRKSFMPEVWRQFPAALAEMQSLASSREFHFGNIYMGRGPFKGVDWNARMGIFRFMVYIFTEYDISILVQTLNPDQVSEWHAFLNNPPAKLGLFDLTKHVDLALYILLVRVHVYLTKTFSDGDRLARVFIDEGSKRTVGRWY